MNFIKPLSVLLVPVLISTVVSLWIASITIKVDDDNDRLNHIRTVAVDVFKEFGDVTAVSKMTKSEWQQLNGYKEILEVLDAETSSMALVTLYDGSVNELHQLGNTQSPARQTFMNNLKGLTAAFKKDLNIDVAVSVL